MGAAVNCHEECILLENHGVTPVTIVQHYIIENLDQDLSRSKLAKKVFFDPAYLSRIFKSEMGISLSDYIKDKRINASKELLCSTELSVSEIAGKVGYYNFSHFSQVFKKTTGKTPVQYRQWRK